MTAETDFRQFYETSLKEKLQNLESNRKTILKRYLWGFLLIAALVAWNYYLASLNPEPFILIISIALSATGSIWFIVVTVKKKGRYRRSFKSDIVTNIVKLFNPEWQYLYDSCVNQTDYERSGIFPHHVDRYDGDDLVVGKVEKTDFQYSELHTQYKQVTYSSKGRRQEHWVTIFKGIFMHADFNKNFDGATYVLPDTAEKLFGSWGQSLQRLSSRGDLIKLENVEFEKLFVVYGSDQVEARYILTPAIMESMVDLHKRFDGEIYFSFVGSRVYFAKSLSGSLFEPNVFRSGVNFNDVKEMHDLLSMITTLIQDLNLNTRIWTKD